MAIFENSIAATFKAMQSKLSKIVPEVELRQKSELVFQINQLKRERGAVILGHNYMEPALFHTVCDITGDSLYLSREAAKSKAEIIVFCGVRFMAETAKILNPTRTVLLPAKIAGCSLASSITAQDVRDLRSRYPGVPIVTYINTYADVKAECDIVCTSGNAVKVVQSLNCDTVIFLPDEYLAKNVAKETGKNIIIVGPKAQAEKKPAGLIGWKGRCEVHEKFRVDDILDVRKQFKDVAVLTHPECSPEVVEASDYSASTANMSDYVRKSNAKHFLILTECSMADNIIADNPDKDILRLCSVRCPHMNEITLQDTLNALKLNQYQIEVKEEIRVRAKRSLERMLEVH